MYALYGIWSFSNCKEHGFIYVGNYHSIVGDKYEAVYSDDGYNKYMSLKIRNVGPKDFGSYKCVAQNSIGETDGDIKLDGEYFQYIMHFSIMKLLKYLENITRA